MLMWGHYAGAHTGLCLEFSVSHAEPFFGRAQPVVYSAKRRKFRDTYSNKEKNQRKCGRYYPKKVY